MRDSHEDTKARRGERWVPDGWRLDCLGNVCGGNLSTGPFGSQLHSHEYTEYGVPVIMPKDLINNRIDLREAARVPTTKARALRKHTLKRGDIVFSRRGDVARFAIVETSSENALCGTGCLKATLLNEYSPEFIAHFLQKNAIRKWLEQNAVGQTMLNLSATILYELPLLIPNSLPEQRKIARVLSTWDRAIATTEKLLANSQQQKKALMQQLLTGKKRFPGFTDEWKEVRLGEICEVNYGDSPKKILTENGKFPIVGTGGVVGRTNTANCFQEAIVIGRKGTIDKLQFFDSPFWAIDTTFYCLVKKDHNPMWLYFRLWMVPLRKYSEASGVPSLSRNTLNHLKFPIPSLPEQQRIASVLTAADKEIESLQQKLSHLKQEKAALMQQLLTGKRRVKVAVGAPAARRHPYPKGVSDKPASCRRSDRQ